MVYGIFLSLLCAEEAANVIKFGKSTKRDADHVGRYGNGLKSYVVLFAFISNALFVFHLCDFLHFVGFNCFSGSMRIGRDFILFTKQLDTMSCVFLLQEQISHQLFGFGQIQFGFPGDMLLVRGGSIADILCATTYTGQLYESVSLHIEKYYIFYAVPLGTLIVIFNLKLMDNGEPELDFTSDPKDILMAESTPDAKYVCRTFV
uniref:Uncharacterized protein n=1 Tax=Eptatretus burgeri TaxID=7764 RepID=A0A8C4NAB2_EPTBU